MLTLTLLYKTIQSKFFKKVVFFIDFLSRKRIVPFYIFPPPLFNKFQSFIALIKQNFLVVFPIGLNLKKVPMGPLKRHQQ